jgi:uncharacterized protein YegP (UPF0339 family)
METFELRRTREGRYFFTFRASSGQAIVDSIPYPSKRHALDALEQIRRHAREAPMVDRSIEDDRRPATRTHAAARACRTPDRAPASPAARADAAGTDPCPP